jgi:hypothetical protein
VADADRERRSTEGPSPDDEPQGREGLSSEDYLDEQEEESFPASDPHSDWSG